MRENIDPSSQYSDAALWDALEKVRLPSLGRPLGADYQSIEPPQGTHLEHWRS